MKKLLIVNNNMKIGGVQKSLYNLLWEMEGRYAVTLYLFQPVGAYMEQLPPWVEVRRCESLFRYLGISQGECSGAGRLARGVLAMLCRLFGREAVLKLLLASQKTLPERYDCAISFLHNGGRKSFYGGVQEFVLHRVKAEKKIAFLHCDYRGCGGDYAANNRSLAKFDQIAACSDGCRQAFLEVLPELADRCVTVYNCHRFHKIRELAQQETVCYDPNRVHVVMVSRLSHEKGIERAIGAVRRVLDAGIPVTLHLIGSGGMEARLRTLVRDSKLENCVRFYGEQSNPYRYVKNADLLLITSYHEAAPMVIAEAGCLGVPVLTTETTSSREMVEETGLGWVCGNSQTQIDEMLLRILQKPELLKEKKAELGAAEMDNRKALSQFEELIGE